MSEVVEKIKEELLKRCNMYKEKYGYDFWNDHVKEDRKERVKECVLRHRGSKDLPRNRLEEQCVADADVMAHFDCIPSLFHLAFGKNEKGLSLEEGTEFVRKKLERDYNKLSSQTKEILENRYRNIIEVLFSKENIL